MSTVTPPFELTNEVRALVVAATGYDIEPSDPALVLVTLNRIALQGMTQQCAAAITEANQQAVEQLTRMRQETLKATENDLLAIAEQKREALRLDLKEAAARAAQIVASIDAGLNFNKAFWIIAGAVAAALFFIGALIGGSLAHGLR